MAGTAFISALSEKKVEDTESRRSVNYSTAPTTKNKPSVLNTVPSVSTTLPSLFKTLADATSVAKP